MLQLYHFLYPPSWLSIVFPSSRFQIVCLVVCTNAETLETDTSFEAPCILELLSTQPDEGKQSRSPMPHMATNYVVQNADGGRELLNSLLYQIYIYISTYTYIYIYIYITVSLCVCVCVCNSIYTWRQEQILRYTTVIFRC